MSIKFRCSECQHGIKVPDAAAGKGVKCPACGKKMRVPGGKATAGAKTRSSRSRRQKSDDGQASDAFLNNLDLDRLVDDEVQLCQKCATEIPPEQTQCPNCGFDPSHLTAEGQRRQKMAAKGIDPASFYESVWKESFAYAGRNFGQVMKTAFILSFCLMLSGLCGYFLIWVATGPPFAFWTLFTTVAVMMPIGWLFVQHTEIIALTLKKKDEIKKIRFDFAQCGMNGIKTLAWILIFGLPFWILFGGLGVLLNTMEVPYGMPIGMGMAAFFVLLFTPQAMSHMTMPVETPAWFFPKIWPTLGVSAAPGAMWVLVFFVANIPAIATIAGTVALGGNRFEEFVKVRLKEGDIHTAKVMVDLAEGATSEDGKAALIDKYSDTAQEEPPEKQWSWLAIPIGGSLLTCLFLGFSSVVIARANGLFTSNLKKGLDLISQRKEIVWESKTGEEKVRTRKTTVPAPIFKRFGASILDGLLVETIAFLLYFVFFQVLIIIFETAGVHLSEWHLLWINAGLGSGMTLLVGIAYFTMTESGEDQASPMKKAGNMYVCTDEFRPISTGQALARVLILIFVSSTLTLHLGSIMALFRKDKKTLHDLLTGTQVRMDKPQKKSADA